MCVGVCLRGREGGGGRGLEKDGRLNFRVETVSGTFSCSHA